MKDKFTQHWDVCMCVCVCVCVCEGEPVQGLGEPESVHAYGCVCVYEQVCTRVSMLPVCVYM